MLLIIRRETGLAGPEKAVLSGLGWCERELKRVISAGIQGVVEGQQRCGMEFAYQRSRNCSRSICHSHVLDRFHTRRLRHVTQAYVDRDCRISDDICLYDLSSKRNLIRWCSEARVPDEAERGACGLHCLRHACRSLSDMVCSGCLYKRVFHQASMTGWASATKDWAKFASEAWIALCSVGPVWWSRESCFVNRIFPLAHS